MNRLAALCRQVADFPQEAVDVVQERIDHETDLEQANRDSLLLYAFLEFQRIVKRAMYEQAEADQRKKLRALVGGKQTDESD